jgi:hypothetical protein
LCTRDDLLLELELIDRDLAQGPVGPLVDPEREQDLRETRLRWRAGIAADLARLEATA